MKTWIVVVLACCISFISCERIANRVWVEKEVVGCSCNPWESLEGLSEEESVREFFEQNDIAVFNTDMNDTGIRHWCFMCCGCPSGIFIGVRIEAADLAQAEALGFVER